MNNNKYYSCKFTIVSWPVLAAKRVCGYNVEVLVALLNRLSISASKNYYFRFSLAMIIQVGLFPRYLDMHTVNYRFYEWKS